jgi:hypothetical protein
MKNNLKIITLFVSALLTLNISVANADPTYAVLDSNGNVTNIIVCGSACAGGTFGGQTVVPQVAADPVTGANRGGFWYGPGTTTYDSNSGTFTMVDSTVVTNSFTETENETLVNSSATIYGGKTTSFKYQDTLGSNLFTRNGFIQSYLENTKASVFVNKNNVTESLDFDSRKTVEEIEKSIQDSSLSLLNSKVQTLISLLGAWVK